MSNPLRRQGVAAALILLLVLAACGDDGGGSLSGNVVKDGLGCAITAADRSPDAPDVDLSAVDTDPGARSGAEPDAEAEPEDDGTDPDAEGAAGATITVDELVEVDDESVCDVTGRAYLTLDMVGVRASDGSEFVNTFGQDRPINVQLNQGQLLAGLEQGLSGMRVGGRRQITVPPELAYGAEGDQHQSIGPDETLVFVVDLVAVTDQPDHCNEARPIPAGRDGKPTTVEMPLEPWTELTTVDLVEGDGEAVGRDAYVRMEYLGVGCFSGAQFDSSWDRDGTFPVALGDRETLGEFMSVIPGWTDGIEGMKVGGVRQIDIPAELAYGRRGSPPVIGPNEPLIFVVELVEIVSAEDALAQAEAGLGIDPSSPDAPVGDDEPEASDGEDVDQDVSPPDDPTTTEG